MRTILVFIFLILMAQFTCLAECGREFDTPTGLSVHQLACAFVNAPDPSLDKALKVRREKKRRKKEQAAADALLIHEAAAVCISNILEARITTESY
jgi:hypothetical protein